VRELTLSEAGPVLTDVYTAGGEVLMGTLRWEKEAEETARKKRQRVEHENKRRELQFAEADIRTRIKALQLDLQRQQGELALYSNDYAASTVTSSEKEKQLHKLRSTDPVVGTKPHVKRRVAGSRKPGKKTGDGAANAD
jgi:circadian clock protein KaiC